MKPEREAVIKEAINEFHRKDRSNYQLIKAAKTISIKSILRRKGVIVSDSEIHAVLKTHSGVPMRYGIVSFVAILLLSISSLFLPDRPSWFGSITIFIPLFVIIFFNWPIIRNNPHKSPND